MSAAATPVKGRCKGTGFPASEQEVVMVEKAPRAAIFQVNISVRQGDARGSRVDNDYVFSARRGCGAGERDQFIGSVGRGDDKRNAIGRGVVRIADLDGKTSGIGDISGSYRRGALRNGVAGGGARRAGD